MQIIRPPFGTVIASIGDDTDDGLSTFADRMQDIKNDAGPCSFALHAEDPDAALIQVHDQFTFIDQGNPIYAGVIDQITETRVSQGEEARQVYEFDGHQRVAQCEWARVYPWRGLGALPIESDRLFNWTSPPFDDSSWIAAGEIMLIDNARTAWPVTPIAIGFPVESGAYMIWDPGTNAEEAPVGECYFRRQFTIPTEGRYVLVAIIDNRGEFYIDSQVLGTVDVLDGYGFVRATLMPVMLSAGDHTLAIKAENLSRTSGDNPAAVAYALYEADDANQPLAGTFPLIVSDFNTLVYGYPPYPPGMTVGQALDILLAEAQARGVLPFVSWNFDEALDSGGNPWSFTGDLSTKTGTDYFTVLKEWAVTYLDFRMNEQNELQVYTKDGMGVGSGVTISPAPVVDPDSGNLIEYEVVRQ